MERLTKRSSDTTHENGVCCTHFMSDECKKYGGNCSDGCRYEEAVWSKLAEYEDAEEQGLLLRLPCNVGDEVFIIGGKYRAGSFDKWINTGKFRISDLEYFGKIVFLTKAEAEKALAELQSK